MRVPLSVVAVFAAALVAAQADTAERSHVITFTNPEAPPEFPGGEQALIAFIETNMVRPQSTVAGKVWVEFKVETDGSLQDIKVVRGINEELDAEALRLVKTFPTWVPGSVLGISQRMTVRQAIDFGEPY